MKNRVFSFLLAIGLCFCASSLMLTASADDNLSTQSYREELLMSYCKFWYADGAGTISHVRYNKVYKPVTYLHGYRLVNQEIEKLSIDDPIFPQGTKDAQKVTNIYEFY